MKRWNASLSAAERYYAEEQHSWILVGFWKRMLNYVNFYATYILTVGRIFVDCFHATLRDENCLFGDLEGR